MKRGLICAALAAALLGGAAPTALADTAGNAGAPANLKSAQVAERTSPRAPRTYVYGHYMSLEVCTGIAAELLLYDFVYYAWCEAPSPYTLYIYADLGRQPLPKVARMS
ncbi:hypothetical protein [Actinomadura sp.]|jgi:hypothetical protein|uniref:hypothetical protein n=1 Tax=Actinomadura sp. TaxID=1989 RepID=UPI0037C73B2A